MPAENTIENMSRTIAQTETDVAAVKENVEQISEKIGAVEITMDRVERGSSVGRMPDSQSREPGFESPLIPFRSLGIFFHFTTPQSTQLYK